MKYSLTASIFDKRGRLLAIGRNSYVKTHPLQAQVNSKIGKKQAFLHAEVAALVKVKDWSKAHRIVITRFNRNGDPVCARPCEACQYAIKLAGIKRIEHT